MGQIVVIFIRKVQVRKKTRKTVCASFFGISWSTHLARVSYTRAIILSKMQYNSSFILDLFEMNKESEVSFAFHLCDCAMSRRDIAETLQKYTLCKYMYIHVSCQGNDIFVSRKIRIKSLQCAYNLVSQFFQS